MNTTSFLKAQGEQNNFFARSFVSSVIFTAAAIPIGMFALGRAIQFYIPPEMRTFQECSFEILFLILFGIFCVRMYSKAKEWRQKTVLLQALTEGSGAEDLYAGLFFADRDGWDVYGVLKDLNSTYMLDQYADYLVKLVQRMKSEEPSDLNESTLDKIYITPTWKLHSHKKGTLCESLGCCPSEK